MKLNLSLPDLNDTLLRHVAKANLFTVLSSGLNDFSTLPEYICHVILFLGSPHRVSMIPKYWKCRVVLDYEFGKSVV